MVCVAPATVTGATVVVDAAGDGVMATVVVVAVVVVVCSCVVMILAGGVLLLVIWLINPVVLCALYSVVTWLAVVDAPVELSSAAIIFMKR